MKKQTVTVVSGTNGFINFWLRFFDTRRETQFWKVFANHTMLTIYADHHQRAAHLVMFKISIHLRWSRPEKLYTQLYVSIAETQLSASMVQSQLTLFQNPQILFRAWRHPYSSPISCLGVYYDNGDFQILYACA